MSLARSRAVCEAGAVACTSRWADVETMTQPWVSRAVMGAVLAMAAMATIGTSTHDARAQFAVAGASPALRAVDAGISPVDAAVPSTALPATSAPSPPAPTAHSARCPEGMVLVEGEYCPYVDQQCLRWIDADEPFPMRCAEFSPTRCLGRRRHVSVCIDDYEYPNRAGAYPQVMVSWYAAARTCTARGARLCSMREWTFACEGEQMLPYPYGLRRDATACNVDHQTRRPERGRLANPATSADESARLYEAVPSGQYNRCVSPFGVHDMTGNADEWVHNETEQPFQSALKGGWWGPIRGRCRPATLAHNEAFVYYQIGFRCCADPTAG